MALDQGNQGWPTGDGMRAGSARGGPECGTDREPFLIGISGRLMPSSRDALVKALERAMLALAPFKVELHAIVARYGADVATPAPECEYPQQGYQGPGPIQGQTPVTAPFLGKTEPYCAPGCDYPVSGYHAKQGGQVKCQVPAPPAERQTCQFCDDDTLLPLMCTVCDSCADIP